MRNNITRFIRKEWFPIITLFIVVYALVPWNDSRDRETYAKGGVSVTLVSRAQSVDQMMGVMAYALKNERWNRYRDSNRDFCYRFNLIRDQDVYIILGGAEKKSVLMFSRNPSEILAWLQMVEDDLKCNDVKHM